MTLQDLGALGEFIGAIVVVITLVYLAYQTRQTNRMLAHARDAQTATMVQANMALWHNLYGKILESETTARVYRNLREGRDPEPEDRERAEALLVMWVLALENLAFQSNLNPFVEGVEQVLEKVFLQNVHVFMQSDFALDWWQSGRSIFGPEVVERIDAGISAARKAAG